MGQPLGAACGYRRAETASEPAQITDALERQLALPGPTLLRVVIRTGGRSDLGRPALKPRGVYERFCAFLAGTPWQPKAEESTA